MVPRKTRGEHEGTHPSLRVDEPDHSIRCAICRSSLAVGSRFGRPSRSAARRVARGAAYRSTIALRASANNACRATYPAAAPDAPNDACPDDDAGDSHHRGGKVAHRTPRSFHSCKDARAVG